MNEEKLKNCVWDYKQRCYVSPSGKRYNSDGEELINPKLDDEFKDVAKLITYW